MKRLLVLDLKKNGDKIEIKLNTDTVLRSFNALEDVKGHVSNAVDIFYGEESCKTLKEIYQRIIELSLITEDKDDSIFENLELFELFALRDELERYHIGRDYI